MVGTRPAMASAVARQRSLLVVAGALAVRRRSGRRVLTEVAVGLGAPRCCWSRSTRGCTRTRCALLSSAEQSTSFRGGGEAGPRLRPVPRGRAGPAAPPGRRRCSACCRGRFGGIGGAPTHRATRLTLVAPRSRRCRWSRSLKRLRPLQRPAPAALRRAGVGGARHARPRHALSWSRTRGRLGSPARWRRSPWSLPVVDQVTLFPYQYTYYNAALDVTGVQRRLGLLARQRPRAAPRHPHRRPGGLRPDPSTGSARPPAHRRGRRQESAMIAGRYSSDTSVDCRTDPLGPLASLLGGRTTPLGDVAAARGRSTR